MLGACCIAFSQYRHRALRRALGFKLTIRNWETQFPNNLIAVSDYHSDQSQCIFSPLNGEKNILYIFLLARRKEWKERKNS